MKTRLAVLNSMASREIEESLDIQKAWGLEVLDLKDAIFGKSIEDLGEEEAGRVSQLCRDRSLDIWTLSSGIFFEDVEKGSDAFQTHLDKVPGLIRAAQILKSHQIRLLIARSSKPEPTGERLAKALKENSWLMPFYQEAVDQIAGAGFPVTIENEVHGCLVSSPDEALAFFEALNRPKQARMTWDVQNLWQEGTFPTLEIYRELRPLIGMVHLKGGRANVKGGPLIEAESLEKASWPVMEILRAVLDDGASPVICLNPSHGIPAQDYKHRPDDYKRDLEFLRRAFPGEMF